MRLTVYENAAQVSAAAAALIAAQVTRKPESVLGLATGSSPVETYKLLAKMHQEGALDFSQCVSYNLDEYVGIPETHECSYHQFMEDNLFKFINMKETHVPNGNAKNMKAECARYDKAVEKAGGIDLQLLGIGRNGHIGFNEPADRFIWGTHVVSLTQSTIDANTRFFDSVDQVPRQAVTMGIGGIMNAKSVLLLAMGKDKAEAIKALVQGDVTPQVQASILRGHHEAYILVDKAAASLL